MCEIHSKNTLKYTNLQLLLPLWFIQNNLVTVGVVFFLQLYKMDTNQADIDEILALERMKRSLNLQRRQQMEQIAILKAQMFELRDFLSHCQQKGFSGDYLIDQLNANQVPQAVRHLVEDAVLGVAPQ